MHIVMLTNAIAPDKLGGLERYVRELSAALVETGSQVTVIAKQIDREHPVDEVGQDGVRVLRYLMPDKTDPTFALRYPAAVAKGVARCLEAAGDYSLIHAHFPVPALPLALRRTPYLYTLHAPVYRELLTERQGSYLLPGPVQGVAERLLKSTERLVVRRASAIITLSEFMKAEVATLDAAAASRTEILAGGVDTERFCPPESRPAHEGIRLFTARRLVPRTGVAALVQAMPAIVAAQPGAHLDIAGAGLQRDHIEAEIARLGLGDAVTLLGRISDEALLAHYQQSDLVVTPTQELEGFGLATAESLACGTPCLVTPAGANPELVRDLSPQLISADPGPAAIAAAAITLLKTDGLLADLASRSRAAAHPQMGWPAIAQWHLRMYESVR